MRTIEEWLVEAFQARDRNMPEWSLRAFREALTLDPEDDAIQLEIARSLLQLGLKEEAVATLHLLSQTPQEDGEFLIELSTVWKLAGDWREASDCLRRIPPQDEHFSRGTLEMILLLDRAGQLKEVLEELRTRTGNNDPKTFAFAEALLAEHEGAEDAAIASLRPILPPVLRSGLDLESGYRLARLLDRQQKGAEAMEILSRCKALESRGMNHAVLGAFVTQRQRYDREVLAKLPSDWFESRPTIGSTKDLLVLGHPRTGSSMLSRLLSSHTGARWIDESPAFDVLARELSQQHHMAEGAEGLLSFLSSQPSARVSEFQRGYRHRLLGEKGLTLPVIDKNPGLSTSYPALHRLLPDSAWLVMQRDPRDVALSCYFQRLGATPLGWSCLTLEGTLATVFHAFAYWQNIRSRLRTDQFLEIRYEELVECPAEIISSTADRLGWSRSGQAGSNPPSAPLNLTPSYADIRRPVYTRAVSRWRNHAGSFPPLSGEQSSCLELAGYGLA